MQNLSLDFKNQLIAYLLHPKNRKTNPNWRSILSQDFKSLELNNFSWAQVISYFEKEKREFLPFIGITTNSLLPTSTNLASPDSNLYKSSRYDELFDLIDLYQKINDLYIHSNYLESLPNNILKFSDLKSMTVIGDRLWNLDSHQIPKNLEELVIESKVVSRQFYKDLHKFDQLQLLGIHQISHFELPFLPNLHTLIVFEPDLSQLSTFLTRYTISYPNRDPDCPGSIQKHILQLSIVTTGNNTEQYIDTTAAIENGSNYDQPTLHHENESISEQELEILPLESDDEYL